MSTETKNKLVPRLRFPEFKDAGEWKETILDKVAEYENGIAHEKDIDENGEYIVVNSKFISTDGEVKKFTNTPFCIANKGDILMVLSDVPNGKAIAKCYIVEEHNRYTVNQRICRITPRKLNPKILYYELNRNPYFLAFDDGVNQTNLRKEDVLKCPLLIPEDSKEQEKIANTLSLVDDLINAQRQKIELLKQHKKGLLQNLFPQEGETVPKLRFPEFTETWDKDLLGNIAKDITTGKLDANAMTEDGQYRFYTCAKNYYKIDRYAFDKEALLIAGNGAYLGYIHYYNGKFNAYQRTYVLSDFTHNVIYLKYFLERFLPKRINLEKKDGNTPYIVLSTLTEMEIFFPNNPKEQQKIADCLSSLDEIITAQTQKIALLQQHKKGLLQNLFPQAISNYELRIKN